MAASCRDDRGLSSSSEISACLLSRSRGEPERLRFFEGPGDVLESLSLLLLLLLLRLRRDFLGRLGDADRLRLRVNDRLSRPRRLGDGLRLISSRAGRLLGLRDLERDREDESDRERLKRRLSLRVGDLERLSESEYLRLLRAGERDLLSSELE